MTNKEPCKLYRNIHEIIHPSISRKNISEYRIIIKDELFPIQIFYPSKEIELKKVLIYIHSKEIDYDYYQDLALKTKRIVLVIDYQDSKEKLIDTINYIINELNNNNIMNDSIGIMGDFDGANLTLEVNSSLVSSIKKVLLSPTNLELEKYDKKNILVISNNEKQTNYENVCIIKESIYDFVHDINLATNEKIYYLIINYLEGVDKNDSKEEN